MSSAPLRFPALLLAFLAALLLPTDGSAQYLLVPMDDDQANHLRAYGLTYSVIDDGLEAEWLLNYRGGSFLLPDTEGVRREAALRGITVERVDESRLNAIHATIDGANMASVPLETAPRIAVYTPPNTPPWDDAVTLALEYAGVPYETIWDAEVLQGELADYDWLHLHHEDFTGQYSKFFLTYAGTGWASGGDPAERGDGGPFRFSRCAGAEAGGGRGDP